MEPIIRNTVCSSQAQFFYFAHVAARVYSEANPREDSMASTPLARRGFLAAIVSMTAALAIAATSGTAFASDAEDPGSISGPTI
jgi:hypothetical protein